MFVGLQPHLSPEAEPTYWSQGNQQKFSELVYHPTTQQVGDPRSCHKYTFWSGYGPGSPLFFGYTYVHIIHDVAIQVDLLDLDIYRIMAIVIIW